MISKTLLSLCMILYAFGYTLAQEMVRIGKIRPLRASEIVASPWGIQFNSFPFHHTVQYRDLDVEHLLQQTPFLVEKADELGIKWVRLSVDWPSVQDDEGKYHFELTDAAITALVKKGMTIYLCLHSGHPTLSGNLPPFNKKQGLDRWLAWVEVMLTRYRDQVDHWEIWNEPNYPSFWKPESSPGDYTRLVASTAPLIRKADPGCKIICGGVARFDVPYLQQLMKEGIAEHVDVLAVHPYHEIPEACMLRVKRPVVTPVWYEESSHKAADLMALASSTEKTLEVWQGECGYPSGQNSTGWQGNGPWSENIQAKWLLRRALTDLSFGAHVSAYFSLREAVSPISHKRLNHKGLIRFDSHGLKKGYFSYQYLTALYRGRFSKAKNVKTEFSIQSAGTFEGAADANVFTVVQKNDSGHVYIAWWLPWRIQDSITPGKVDVMITDWNATDPVLVNLLNGDIYRPQVEKNNNVFNFRNLPLSDSPWVLVDHGVIR